MGELVRLPTATVLAALLLTGCSSSAAGGASSDVPAVHYAVLGCRDFRADDQMFDHLELTDVHRYLNDVRDSAAPLQHAADLDNDWVPLAYNAHIIIDALRKADAAVDAGRDPVWTDDNTIGAAAWTVRRECRRALAEVLDARAFG